MVKDFVGSPGLSPDLAAKSMLMLVLVLQKNKYLGMCSCKNTT